MGINQAPDIAQEMMERTLKNISDNLEIYIDNIGIFSNSWDDHLIVLDKVCKQLENKKFLVKPLKCEFGVKESEFLGHWLTLKGLKPLRKKIQGIIDMEAPTNLTQLRSFLGMVTYYRDMWPKRSHILSPLTELMGTTDYKWGPPQEKAFKQMKAVMAKYTLLAYADHNKKLFIRPPSW